MGWKALKLIDLGGGWHEIERDSGTGGWFALHWACICDAGWSYYREISLSPATPEADYQVKVELNTSNFDYSHANSDGSDLRFYLANGTALSYWIENWDTSGTSIIWVKVPTSGTSTIYLCYGNSSATSQSNGDNVFEFFDDFEGTSLDTNKWTVLSGSVSVSDSAVCINGNGSNDGGIYTKNYNHPSNGVIIEWRGKVTSSTDSMRGVGSYGGSYLYEGTGGLGYYTNKYIKVFDYSGSSTTTSATINLDTWYRMRTELHPDKIKAIRLDDNISAERANTLASHPISIYSGWDGCYDFVAVRKYVSSEPSASIGSEQSC